ncbi:hypothetical protein HDR70_00360 [bacterium]|nr:hypothetical protein [bacterium]
MYYYGYFRNLDTSRDKKGWLYKVVIITNFRDDEFDYGGELLLDGDSPFQVSYSTDEGDIYKPYKCSTATVTLHQQDYNFSFNDAKGGNVLVMLLKSKNTVNTEDKVNEKQIEPNYNRQLQVDRLCYNVEWIGFATPNAYSQDYANFFDSFELEAQDALSTLQYFPYKFATEQDPLFETNPNISFLDIVKKSVSMLRQYNKIYVSSTLQLPTLEDGDILNFMKCDQRNFFDEDGKANTTLEVIEMMMQYLNLSIIPYQDSLYIIDYEGLANDYNEYYEYVRDYEKIYPFNHIDDSKFILQSNKAPLEDYHTIQRDDFSSDDAKISIQGIANKFVIKDSLYPYDTIEPNLEDNKKILFSKYIQLPKEISDKVVISEGYGRLITEIKSDNKWLDYVETVEENGVKKVVDRDYIDRDLIVFCDSSQSKKDGKKDVTVKQKVYIKYCGYDNWNPTVFDNSQLLTYWYNQDKVGNITDENDGITLTFSFGDPYHPSINESQQWNYDFLTNHVGAQLIQYHSEKVDDFGEYPKQLELKPAVMICKGGRHGFSENKLVKIEFDRGKTQPMFTIKSKNVTVGCGDYFHVEMKWMFYPQPQSEPSTPCNFLPIEITPTHIVQDNKQRLFVRFGRQYFDGRKWCDYMKPYEAEFDVKIGDEDSVFGKELKFKPMLEGRDYNFKDLLGVKDGLVIPSPYAHTEDSTMSGNLEISVERPYGLDYPNYQFAIVSDIKIEVITKSTVYDYCSQDDDSDTQYSNVIQDKDEIEIENSTECNITTWDRKKSNYSSTIFSRYLDWGENNNLRVSQIFNMANGEILRAEELAIANKLNQYSTPTLAFDLSLHYKPFPYSVFKYHYFNGKLFIVNGMEFDYFRNSYLVNLIEKK